MTKTTRLNDLQLILLSHAAKSDSGSALPLPAAADDTERANKELKSLLRRNLLVEAEVDDAAASWRSDDNDQRCCQSNGVWGAVDEFRLVLTPILG